MALKASNNYIEAIFDCYKNLIKFFRSKGAMKKVFETTREFEDVISNMLTGVIPPEEMNVFFSIFEEARILTMRLVLTKEIVQSKYSNK